MKKILTLLLTLCLLLGLMPTQALASVGDILPPTGSQVETKTEGDTFVLKNEYIRVTLNKQNGVITTSPAAIADSTGQQKPFCEFITYEGNGYNRKDVAHPANLSLKSVAFVNKTPNGNAKAIKAEYTLTSNLSGRTLTASTAVYYELVQCKENESSKGDWGVLTSVDPIKINNNRDEFNLTGDMGDVWGYTLDAFTGMGHANATDSPAIKMSRTVYNYDKKTEISTESSVLTSQVENLSTWKPFSQGTDWCYNYITEVYVDGYAWANPFVGLSSYYKDKTIKAYLSDTVSVTPGSNPANTRVECRSEVGHYFSDGEKTSNSQRFLWGFRGLTKGADSVPSKPDEVNISINAKRLAAFADGSGGVTVEYIADDAALETLKKQYGNPVALISGDYESKNGTDFTFTGEAAMLSPSVTATWGSGGKLIIHRNGTIEHSGVSLNAPSFKFYQPNSKNGEDLKISLTKDGFAFTIDPKKNDAIVYVDIPYATVKLKSASTDAAGNLVLGGKIGFRTIFEGAEFEMEKLGYGLNEKKEFKVNGVHAKGKFDTKKMMALELAKIDGEVNTFKGEESYAFELELNAFDLFETEAELALQRTKDGSLIPDKLWFYVKSNPGIPLIPPIPIGQLNGGGAGFKDLADTVKGNYLDIPPIKLRGALTGTYLHLIEGTGNVVLGPSEISLKATDVGIVGLGKNAQIIESFGYSLYLNGQERTYNGNTYRGIYFGGSEELKLNLPSKTIDIFVLDTAIKLGAFGGVNDVKNTIYLGIGANGTVKGALQIPSNLGIPLIGGLKLASTDIDLIMGGHTTAPIKDVSVSDAMKEAFKNVDVYLGAMAGVNGGIVDARVWVLVPNIVKTNFRKGGGWDIETKWFGKLPEWDWRQKGVEPVVQSVMQENGGRAVPVLLAAEPPVLKNGGSGNTKTITVNAQAEETPYILLAFENTVTEQAIKNSLSVKKQGANDNIDINWLGDDKKINSNYVINADTDIIRHKTENKDYRIAILRLKDGGTYQVNTGALELVTEKSKDFAVTPFEKLNLTLDENLSGGIKYAETDTKYVLRTYFANQKGGADYLIDEQTVENPASISVTIPKRGKLVPTGWYHVTSFLMTEKEADLNGDGKMEKALAAIDSQTFNDTITYTNDLQPDAPENVNLELAGNEVMTAAWDAVTDTDGYAVTIYQKNGSDWIDTGFGYDLKKSEDRQPPVTSIDMALTVGGNAVEVSETGEVSAVSAENLSANQTYKVGVRAYKLDTESEGAKYYSAESDSSGVYLPEYTPLNLNLSVNDAECTKDENGVYHAYVDGKNDVLKVSSSATGSVSYKVTRMDTNVETTVGADGTYKIPDFEGSLMFKIDGIQDIAGSTAQDTTSVFLLVSVDKTAPVLTLSAPIFYADPDSGKYTITGTADAGSQIIYNDDDGPTSVDAADNGSFAISGTLEESTNTAVLSLYAKDSAENASASQAALITKQKQQSGGSSSGGSSYVPVQKPTILAGKGFQTMLSADGTKLTITAAAGYEITDVLLNGVSKGSVTQLSGLKTGDKVEIKTAKKAESAEPSKPTDPTNPSTDESIRNIKEGVENTSITLKSKLTKNKKILLSWTKSKGYKVDRFQIYRSVKKNSGYGKKAFFATKNGEVSTYLNTKNLRTGKTYYYKLRGVRIIDGKKYYTQWSNKAWRTVK